MNRIKHAGRIQKKAETKCIVSPRMYQKALRWLSMIVSVAFQVKDSGGIALVDPGNCCCDNRPGLWSLMQPPCNDSMSMGTRAISERRVEGVQRSERIGSQTRTSSRCQRETLRPYIFLLLSGARPHSQTTQSGLGNDTNWSLPSRSNWIATEPSSGSSSSTLRSSESVPIGVRLML